MNLASELHNHIAKVCPIDGVTIGDPADNSTWVINFKDSTTPEQRAAAIIAGNTFDASKQEKINKAKDALADIDKKTIRALREYVAALPDAPKAVKDRETEAAAEREKLK